MLNKYEIPISGIITTGGKKKNQPELFGEYRKSNNLLKEKQ